MGKFIKGLLGLIALLLISAAAIHFTGNTAKVFVWVLKPHHGFDLALKAPAPDYADPANWAALPEKASLADLTPEGIAPRAEPAEVDVFFIHPTGYMKGAEWNSPMEAASNTEENTKWMLANQASAFNGCCDIFAPRYREASIFAYFAGDREMMNQALDFAYGDVARAFDHFIAAHSNGRPFIIASHSQGTHHAMTLLKERISGTPLKDRLVAAYIIGGDATREQLAAMPDIGACDEPDDLHCVIHWATFGEGGFADESWVEGTLICTNPLTWKNDGGPADASLHKGGVLPTGEFSFKLFGPDDPEGISFGPLAAPITELTSARCENGMLFVQDLSEGAFSWATTLPGKNYHGHDYPLFHMDIRENAKLRVAAYLETQSAGTPQEED
ncbi:MAG: DUF3089 domain-containing protein [Alphaproteobacteria bacterium]|nr:MAG: DUF3089 domain-containing protein [Alphaproteobacteria bacterium]